jgi:hypothetical protein
MVQPVAILTGLSLHICEGMRFQHDGIIYTKCGARWATIFQTQGSAVGVLRFWWICTFWIPVNMKKVVLGCHLSVHVYYVCMDMCPTSTCTIEWILFVFSILDFIHYRSAPGEFEHSSSKNRGRSDDFQDTTWRFSWKWLKNLDIFVKCNVKFKMKGANNSGMFASYWL